MRRILRSERKQKGRNQDKAFRKTHSAMINRSPEPESGSGRRRLELLMPQSAPSASPVCSSCDVPQEDCIRKKRPERASQTSPSMLPPCSAVAVISEAPLRPKLASTPEPPGDFGVGAPAPWPPGWVRVYSGCRKSLGDAHEWLGAPRGLRSLPGLLHSSCCDSLALINIKKEISDPFIISVLLLFDLMIYKCTLWLP